MGCGAGGNLDSFSRDSWNCVGMDFDRNYVAYRQSMGLDVRLGDLEELNSGELPDLIILSHVLEHVEPIGMLRPLQDI